MGGRAPPSVDFLCSVILLSVLRTTDYRRTEQQNPLKRQKSRPAGVFRVPLHGLMHYLSGRLPRTTQHLAMLSRNYLKTLNNGSQA